MLALHTPRLTLRDLEEGDWRLVLALGREPSVVRFQTWLRVDSEDQARRWVLEAMGHNRLRPRRAYNLAVVGNGEAIGWLGFGRVPESAERDFEFGYALLPSFWGRGYATGALGASLAFMFGSLHAEHVFGEADETNVASLRVMERVGMRPAGTRRETDPETGEQRELRRFGLDAAGWRALRGTPRP